MKDLINNGTLPAIKSNSSESQKEKMNDMHQVCFAEQMTNVVLSIAALSADCDSECCFSDTFYQECVDKFSGSSVMSADDKELLIIHAKQLMMMLKKLGIVSLKKGNVAVSSKQVSYKDLFTSFWSETEWSGLFPSLSSVAEAMQNDRYLLAELLLSREGKFLVDDIASDYFAGMSSIKEMLLYVSFFDFSFITWMRHFGIVELCESKDGRVYAELTPEGRSFLSSID